ncbi:HAD family hydrolase [Paenibacillus arenilitoris]|uniref:HAD family hydrolase n=1 Tax=Paenibacillus arenilitoris TaxID=2772299 RepID=A0A927CS06_9BACL|nr:HAD family hydrolase [Paenibacillus arenilitoris]MBD2871146.1 HAD family hydrolase [Paenibacillus arenilitoris]
MKPKAVLFDLFETLVTEFRDGRRMTERKTDYMALIGLSNEEFKREWGSRAARRMTGELADYRAVLAEMLASRGLPNPKDTVERLYEARIQEKTLPFRDIHPAITELLGSLREQRIRIGLISNCTEEEVRFLHQSELAPYFDDIVLSYEVGLAKPDREIYRLGCRRLAIEPEEAVFVGDGGSRELEGAREAGIRALHACWFNAHIPSGFEKLHAPSELLDRIRKSS